MKKPATKDTRNLGLLLGAFGALTVLYAWDTFHPAYAENVLVIDAGADLAHDELKNFVHFNESEKNGQTNVDDDRNGFVDDVAGWNLVSNDGVYMPQYIKDVFTQDRANAQAALDLYTRLENGDESARAELRANPDLRAVIGLLLQVSHGTHVSGIAARASDGTARLQSANLFNGSTPGPVPSGLPGLNRLGVSDFLKDFLGLNGDSSNTGSFFDDRARLDGMLAQARLQNQARVELMTRYIEASGPKVVNLSLGISKAALRSRFEMLWKQELVQRGLDPSTERDLRQEDNFNHLVEEIFATSRDGWSNLFSANPGVVFVVAAGNDGSKLNPSAGDLEKNPATPSMAAVDHDNVISVAAANPAGVLADFSCYSARSVNVAAWGTAVPSLAPGNLHVTMSGTSMAAPFVSGLASEVRTINPRLSPREVRDLLEQSGKKTESLSGKVKSGAIVDAAAALAAARASASGQTLASAINNALSMRQTLENKHRNAFGLRGLELSLPGQVVETDSLVRGMMPRLGIF